MAKSDTIIMVKQRPTMDFFNYKSEVITIGDVIIGHSRVRFRDNVFSAHVYPERVTTYLDGKQIVESLPEIVAPLNISDMGRSIDLYHPVLGVVVGTITIGEIVGIDYSLCIATDKRNDEMNNQSVPEA
jgi:hypothetical protein